MFFVTCLSLPEFFRSNLLISFNAKAVAVIGNRMNSIVAIGQIIWIAFLVLVLIGRSADVDTRAFV